ncbi:MAG: hypothetical protein DMG32_24780 [Acidobacteria bacterium]|nr:MAG: hypothetical protein DMG32_24780 [Acidobacteriota bacterium]
MILDGVMINGNNLDQLGERRAAILLGLTAMELRQLSRLSGLGHLEKSSSGQQMVYTYDELRSLGCWRLKPSTNSLRTRVLSGPASVSTPGPGLSPR